MVTPLSLTPTYSLDGWVGNATDATGVDWIVTEESGWSDAAPVRLAIADREDINGGVSGPVWRGPRLINLKGLASAPDRAAMLNAKETIRDVADDGPDPYPLTVAEAHLTRVAWVKQVEALRIRDINARGFEFELALRADDPLRYSPVVESVTIGLPATIAGGVTFPIAWPLTWGTGATGGSAGATNTGNAPVYPVLTIAGPVTNPVITNVTAGRVTALTVVLDAGEVLTVDNAARTVLLGGGSRFDALTPGSTWWALAPGDNEIGFSATAGGLSPSLTVTYRSAWK